MGVARVNTKFQLSLCPQAHSSQTQAPNLYRLGLLPVSSCRHLIISVGQTSPTLVKSFFTEKSPYPSTTYPWPCNALPPHFPAQRLCPPSPAPAPTAGSNEEHTHETFIVGNTPCRVCQIPALIGEAGSVGCGSSASEVCTDFSTWAQVPATSIKPGLILPGGGWGDLGRGEDGFPERRC